MSGIPKGVYRIYDSDHNNLQLTLDANKNIIASDSVDSTDKAGQWNVDYAFAGTAARINNKKFTNFYVYAPGQNSGEVLTADTPTQTWIVTGKDDVYYTVTSEDGSAFWNVPDRKSGTQAKLVDKYTAGSGSRFTFERV